MTEPITEDELARLEAGIKGLPPLRVDPPASPQEVCGVLRIEGPTGTDWYDALEDPSVGLCELIAAAPRLLAEVQRLRSAIRRHRDQRADDRCWLDDDVLYAALGDGIRCDRRVGSKEEMLANCERFIDRRCEGGYWPNYADLEAEIARLKTVVESLATRCAGQAELLERRSAQGEK